MIIHSLTLQNFGIYAGEYTFELTPAHNGRFQQPIILLRGQNGVGKSTIMETIRLALHGKLSLGNRITQKDYETYLDHRLHRQVNGEVVERASVELTFDHVFLGKRHEYRVQRRWSKQNNRIITELQLWVDDAPGADSDEEKEYLLRELVPPGVAELFFFDGEKVTTLSEAGDASDALLAETVKNLLGLHLVEQLDRDLNIYLTRQTGIQELQQYQVELTQLHEESADLQKQRDEIRHTLVDCRHRLFAKRGEISLLESRIAREGGQYAAKESERSGKRQELLQALAQSEQEIQEICRGVFPFAVAPKLLTGVRHRLEQETAYERWKSAQPFIEKLEALVMKEQGVVYNTKQNSIAETNEAGLLGDIQKMIEEGQKPPIPETAVVHRVSAETRGVLFNWIDEALSAAPQQLAQALQKREGLQKQLAEVAEALQRVPVNEILQPLQDDLRQLDRELGRLEAEMERLVAEDKRLTFHIERVAGSNRQVSEKIAGINTDEDRIKLAARTKLLLGNYQQQLIAQKLHQLADQLTKRFNQLSRKRNFIERVMIDPESFTITLYRAGKVFPRAQLSAGEEQIFAIATLWALREVSGRPLPVIIDTPLSRLDDEHRRTMLAEFMPQVAQQVIVLATNIEIDDPTARFLQPALAREYHLQSDGITTRVTKQTVAQSVAPQQAFITLEEVAAHDIE